MQRIGQVWDRIEALVADVVASDEGPCTCDACGRAAGWSSGGLCAACYLWSAQTWEAQASFSADALGLSSARWPRLTRAALAELWKRERDALAAADAAARATAGA